MKNYLKFSVMAASLMAMASIAEAGSLKLGHSTWVGYGPFYIARDKGFFKEEGVDVELVIMEDTPIKMGALMAGQLDLVASTVDEFPVYMKPGIGVHYVLAVDNSKGGDGIAANKDIARHNAAVKPAIREAIAARKAILKELAIFDRELGI